MDFYSFSPVVQKGYNRRCQGSSKAALKGCEYSQAATGLAAQRQQLPNAVPVQGDPERLGWVTPRLNEGH